VVQGDKYLTGDAPADEQLVVWSLVLPDVSEIFQAVTGAIAAVSFLSQWEQQGTLSVVDTCDYIKRAIVRLQRMNWQVGLIVATSQLTLPANLLLCDGTTYTNESYPLLAQALGQGGGSFVLPDLRDKFILGAGTSHAVDTTGGTEIHTLTEAEMPSHSHTNTPHAHSEVLAAPQVTTIGAGAPQPTAIPAVGSTGLTGIIIDSTGGGQAHNNMPPYHALRYAIIAELYS